MFQFPFGTMHQLNLDWFLQKFNELVEEWSNAEAGIDGALQAEIDRVEAAMTDLYAARDAAVNAADAAVPAAASAVQDALISEGFALGEQNGTPVSSGSPYYENNAKYYKVESGTYRYLSEAYARGTMGGTPVDPGDAGYEDNAKYYKDAADNDATATAADRVQTGLDAASAAADALIAEGQAVGEQNGTPVSSGSPYYQNNAKYYAQQTSQDKSDTDTLKDAANAAALRAEGYSSGTQNGTPVSSGSPYYENNAAYFYGLSAGTSGDLAQDMIAVKENSTTVTVDHPANSYVIVSGILYKTTKDVLAGATLTVGTNCEVVTLGSDIYNYMISGKSKSFNITGLGFLAFSYYFKKGYVYEIYNNGTASFGVQVSENGSDYEGAIASITVNTSEIMIPDKNLVSFRIYANTSGGSIIVTEKPINDKTLYNSTLFEILTTFTAARNYNINEFIVLNGTLYRITAPVASGADFRPGTNITPTSLSNELTNILNSI